ncbi:glycosyltransferase family 2 protein [Enterococcus faecium]|nr:glycosyltransferase family 2 protein [Enterococcus faecium]
MNLSIIVPIYNVEKYLEKCLTSIQNQTYDEYEVLMINDGSTDSSKQIAEKFSNEDLRFKYFEVTNAGVSNARNIGISKSSGNYLTFIDSDDFIDQNHLQLFMTEMDYFDLVVGGFKVIDSEIDIRKRKENAELSRKELIQGILKDSSIYSFPWNKFFRREIVVDNKIAFRTDIHYGEDLIFDIEYALHVNKAYVLSSDTYHYVQHSDSASATLDKPKLMKRMTDIDAMLCTIGLLGDTYSNETKFLKERIAREGIRYWYKALKLKVPKETVYEFKKKINPYISWYFRDRKIDVNTFKLLLRYLAYRTVSILK